MALHMFVEQPQICGIMLAPAVDIVVILIRSRFRI
jgi:hypothetical protein